MLSYANDLSGRFGSNRSSRTCAYDCLDDNQAIEAWLKHRSHLSESTRNLYCKAIKVLKRWANEKKNKPLSSLEKRDLTEFFDFLDNLDPEWVSEKSHGLHSNAYGYRLFKKAPSTRRKAQFKAAIVSFFSFCVTADYLAIDIGVILNDINKKRQITGSESIIYESQMPSEFAVQYLYDYLDRPCNFNQDSVRARFAISLMNEQGLRVGEIEDHNMSHFVYREMRDGRCGWFMLVLSKKTMTRKCMGISPDMLADLKKYRKDMGLSELPEKGETTPLLFKTKDYTPISTRYTQKLVNAAVQAAAKDMEATYPAEAKALQDISPHDFRRLSIKRIEKHARAQGKSDALNHAQKHGRHSSLNTTQKSYATIHYEEQQAFISTLPSRKLRVS